MKKFTIYNLQFTIFAALLTLFLLIHPVLADSVIDKGINFLKSKQDSTGKVTGGFSAPSQWSSIAFAANGIDLGSLKNFLLTDLPTNNTATDWESRILAIIAIDGDPTNFGGTNYLQKLEGFANNNQTGDVCSVNDDIFGLLALIASGNASNVQIKQDTLNFIINKQDPTDGGFGFSAPSCAWYSTSSDMTAAGLQALQAAKDNGLTNAELDNAITKAKNYLLANQYTDGGFGYGSSDADTTGWVLMAFNVLGLKDSSQAVNARNWLLSKQQSDGGFPGWSGSDSTTTAQTLIALAGKSWVLKIFTSSVVSASPTPASSSAPSSVTSSNLSVLFDNGIFVLPSGKTKSATPKLTLASQTKISLATDSQTSVTLPSGTIITRSDGQDLDASALTATTVSTNNVSGLSSNLKTIGALQWGIPNISLSFSEPITLSIFLGTLYNGSTVTIARSATGVDNWTTDGLTSSSCVVSDGLCTFQATKASVYVATQTTSTTTTPSPTPTPSPSSQTCNEQKPGSAPILVSAEAISDNQVKLTWSKASDPVTYYLVAYGRTPEKLEYGAPNVGGKDTTSYTVSGLSGGTAYYFKVRAGNGCTPGDYSNGIAVTPGGQVKETPAENFQEGVLGIQVATPSAMSNDLTQSPPSDNLAVRSFKSSRILFIILSAVCFGSAFVIWRKGLKSR